MGALREQSLTHVKERVALKAILDDKVRALISDIGQSVAELPIEVRCPPASGSLHVYVARAHLPFRNTHLSCKACAGVCRDPVTVTGACVLRQSVGLIAAVYAVQVRQHPKLLRQVLALDKLVGATVKALSSASASAVHSSS